MQKELQRIEPEALHAELQAKAPVVILDVRTPVEFEAEHIPGSINIPLADLISAASVQKLDGSRGCADPTPLPAASADQTLVIACRTGKRAAAAAEVLEVNGYAPKVLVGGIVAWGGKNFPVVQGTTKGLPLDQQVQLIAGSLVLVGTLLGAFVDKAWLVLPCFVGAGLTYAGLSGKCGLAIALSRAPWNRKSTNTVSCSS